MEHLQQLISDLSNSHSCFHVIANLEEKLLSQGFIPLVEGTSWRLEEGKGYFVKRNDSSLIAFALPKKSDALSFHITATHSDSPTFKIKPNPIRVNGRFLSLMTEPYGGGIYHTWMDRALSFAGRILYSDESGVHSKLIDVDRDLLDIPSLCIHFDRGVNQGKEFNAAKDLIPLFGTADPDFDFNAFLAKEAGLEGKEILSHDLFLYVRENARVLGKDSEFLLSPREDDLSSAYSSFYAFLESENKEDVCLYCCFDNEEVGSLTRQGANSTFLKDVYSRICAFYGYGKEEAAARSFLLSIDNGHAYHPNYPEFSAEGHHVSLNEGVLIKYNANQSYTTDGLSAALLRLLAKKENLPLQEFTNRSDLRGGSTLGNLSNGEISFLSADIGLPQLAMHSCNEILGCKDVETMVSLCRLYYSTSFFVSSGDIKIR